MRVLIVEDAAFMAETFKELLPKGHDVVCVSHFLALRPDLYAVKIDGSHVLLRKKIDVAFVDGECGRDFGGPAIVDELTRRGVQCVGMSSDPEANAEMLKSGAVLDFQKPFALCALALGLVPLEELASSARSIEERVLANPDVWDSKSEAHRRVDAVIKESLLKKPV